MNLNTGNQNSQYLKILTSTSALVLLFSIFCLGARAQSAPTGTGTTDKSLKAYKLPPNLKKYFHDKYNDQIDDISSNLQETPQGPRGTMYISGHIKTNITASTHENNPDSARKIAQAFLKDEGELLGLKDLNELREESIRTDIGPGGEITHVYYVRYIGNFPLDGATLHVVVGPDNTITYTRASLVPVPAELYQAVSKKTISEDDVRQIIEKDLRSKGITLSDVVITDIKQYAMTSQPYVVWKLNVVTKTGSDRWNYVIDAIRSKIVTKEKYFLHE